MCVRFPLWMDCGCCSCGCGLGFSFGLLVGLAW